MLAAVLLQKMNTKQRIAAERREEILEKCGPNDPEGVFCRTCLSTVNLQRLFRSNSRSKVDDEEMSYKLKLVTGLEIKADDGLSQKICKKCLCAIDFALQFRFKSKQAEEALLKMVKEQKIKKEVKKIIQFSKEYPFRKFNVNKEKDEPITDQTNEKLFIKYPFEVKIEYVNEKEQLNSTNNDATEQNEDSIAIDEADSEEDLKPLKLLKKESDTVPVKEVEPIITIKKVPNEINKGTQNTDKLKIRKTRHDKNMKRKKQDKSNKVTTFIKVDNLPADWCGYINPGKREPRKRKSLPKIPKERENEKVKDPVTGEEIPVFIKVDNLPEDMDKVPMPKVARPHRRVPVPDGPPYKCTTCGKEYMKRPLYLSHVRFHTHYHICELCGKICQNPYSLRTHQRARHGLMKIHKCSQCDYSAATRCALTVHERRHTDERPFVCDHCGAAFYTRRTLAQHVGVHMPANIQCPHCPKKLKSMKLLSNHRARKHAKRYSYRCPVCPKVFNDNNAVHKHLSGYHGMPRDQHPAIEKQLLV